MKENVLVNKLKAYKKKYYLNQLVRGIIFFIASLLSIYLLLTSIEFGIKPGTSGRTLLFFSFIGLFAILFYKWIWVPVSQIYGIKQQISDEEAASQIGLLFPKLKDKLLNTIQLATIDRDDNSLVHASIEKRTEELSLFTFSSGIKLSGNKRYIKYVAYPSVILIGLLIFIPQFLTESTVRLIRYNEEFAPPVLFTISPTSKELFAFRNEDYTLELQVDGSITPDNVYLNSRGRRIKMKAAGPDKFIYTFQKVQSDFSFSAEAGDYSTGNYTLNVHSRPDLKNFNVELSYPKYTQRKNTRLENTGNLNVPEGTMVQWTLNTIESRDASISFDIDSTSLPLEMSDNQIFVYKKRLIESTNYSIGLKNEFSGNKDKIQYNVEVIKDKHPSISFEAYQDTTLFSYLVLGGQVADDYGLSRLELMYRVKSQDRDNAFIKQKISLNRKLKDQNYFYQWIIDSLHLSKGDKLEYFLQIWDNDGVNGSKSTKTGIYQFNIPTAEAIKENVEKQAEGAKKQLDKSLEEAKELKQQIEDIQNELKTKKKLDWQDKKQLNELLKQKEKLNKELKKLQEENKAYTKKKERFFDQKKEIKEKMDQLQKLMEDVLDEETKKLYEELRKLLDEQKGVDDIQEVMDQIENKEENVEQEIERAIEMFKRLQMENKLEDVVNDLEKLEKEQKDLSEETKDKSNDLEDLEEKQEELNDKFDEIKEDIDELEELNEELKNPEDLEDTEEQEEEISEEQENSKEELNNKKRKKASQSQQDAGEKMQEMKEKMEQMQQGMEMTMLQENLDNLRDIVDNLVKVSFDQEGIKTGFDGVSQSDPRFIALSQKQLKLRDDSKIIEDSLMALAGRVFQIASFVTREVGAMNDHVESSLQALKDRKKADATKNQQFAMTSINNLALLLDDVLQQMQQQMADAMGKPQKGKKGQKKDMPGLTDLQRDLNNKINQLKKSGKSGRQLSEELAKMAAQQEMIRQQLEEMQGQLGEKDGENGAGGKGIKEAIKKMEQTELDLVNKNITQQTLKRQQDILTRLLKSEDAMRERELDEKREADQAKEYQRELPPEFQEYLKAKEKETELLRTIPLQLNPYYKEEVNKYFKRLSEQ